MRRPGGFTLLEILVALAVLSIVMAVALKNSGTTASNAAYLRDKTLAHWVAMNKVAELQISKNWTAPGLTSGEVAMAERNWRWAVKVEETPDRDIRRAEVSVFAESGGKSPLATLLVYIGRPVIS